MNAKRKITLMTLIRIHAPTMIGASQNQRTIQSSRDTLGGVPFTNNASGAATPIQVRNTV